MNKHYLNGLIAAPFTPMDESGNINPGLIEKYARHLIDSGVSGAFVCGTTGEAMSLTTDERKTILKEWIGCSGGALKIIGHVGGNCLPECIELATHAEKAGAFAIGAFAPSFFKPATVKDLVNFFAPLAGAVPDLPFYYYHMPSMTGFNLPASEILPFVQKEIPSFAGIKYTHFDLYDMQQCIAYADGRFQILHGYDEILLCGLSLGVKSAVGSTYNYMPSVYLDLWDAYNDSDMERARELQQFSVSIVRILNKYGGGVRAGKAIMALIGIDCGSCRLPIRKMDPADMENLKNDLLRAGFFDHLKF